MGERTGAGVRRLRIAALVPAHNEEADIANTIASLLAQTRPLDLIVIGSDNSADRTVEIARRFPVEVFESRANGHCPACIEKRRNTHRKSGVMNQAWELYLDGDRFDLLVCADGDTILPPHAVADWEREFLREEDLGGSSSQPVLTGGEHWVMRPPDIKLDDDGEPVPGPHPLFWAHDRLSAFWEALQAWYLPRMQRFEFAKTITQNRIRGWVNVISGTGCAYHCAALAEVAAEPGQDGPWTYESVVEDYHLTYQLRRAGWKCRCSPTVWCLTGSMVTLKSLWYQRLKWTGGTDADLVKFGLDRLNCFQWLQNVLLGVNVTFWIIWFSLIVPQVITGGFHVNWKWQAFGFSLIAFDLVHMKKMKGAHWRRDWKDWVLAGSMFHLTVYNILSVSWGVYCWGKVLYSHFGDLWAPQYKAEGMKNVTEEQVGA